MAKIDHAPAVLTTGKISGIHSAGAWVSSGVSLDVWRRNILTDCDRTVIVPWADCERVTVEIGNKIYLILRSLGDNLFHLNFKIRLIYFHLPDVKQFSQRVYWKQPNNCFDPTNSNSVNSLNRKAFNSNIQHTDHLIKPTQAGENVCLYNFCVFVIMSEMFVVPVLS
jgi:hypothetical protein